MAVNLKWRNRSDFDSHDVYRSGSPIDKNSLPASLGSLAGGVTEYSDITAAASTQYYYVVKSTLGTREKFSEVISVMSAELSSDSPNTQTLTIASGKVGADLTNYPVVIDMALITDAVFWASVAKTDGGDIRVYDTTLTAIPFDLLDINVAAKTGLLVAKITVLTASDTEIKIKTFNDSGMVGIPAASVGGQHQTWGGFDAVYLFRGDLTDRTGNGHTLTTNSGTPNYTTGFEFSLGGGTDSASAAWDANVYDASWVNDDDVVMMVGCSHETEVTGWQFAMATLTSRTASTDVIMLGQRDSDSSFSLRYASTSEITGTANEAIAGNGNNRVLHSELTGGQIEFWINGARVTSASTAVKRKGYLQIGYGGNPWRGNIGIATMRRGTLSNQQAAADKLNYDPNVTFFR